jgi:hypothetical protein
MFSSDGYGIHIVKGTLYPITGHKGPEGEERYSSLSLTSALDGSGDFILRLTIYIL